jgi:outer membrane murein-binding lipoprotein Lpp
VCAIVVVPGALSAQEGTDTPEMQELTQQFQQMRNQVLLNMVQKGIDPREFFGDLRQQMQNGTLDVAALQQKLVDQGLIEKDAITQMQTKAQGATLGSIRRQLGVTDDEWKVLEPKIQRILAATGDAGSSNPMSGLIAGFMRGQSTASDVTKRMRELQGAVSDPATKPDALQQKLTAWRDARQKAKEELAAAQKDLIELLSPRQEAVLAMLGLL